MHADIDECDVDELDNPCVENAYCVNTVGSYECEPKPGYIRTSHNTVRGTGCSIYYRLVMTRYQDFNMQNIDDIDSISIFCK